MPAHPSPDLPGPGDRLSVWQIERVLGRGGHGATYLCRDDDLGLIAVKEVCASASDPSEDASAADRGHGVSGEAATEGGAESDHQASVDAEPVPWRRIGDALATVDHPHVVRVHRCLESEGHEGRGLLVMAYVEAQSLAQALADSDEWGTEGRLRSLMVGLLEGLDAVHAAGVLHRDVKPSNILLPRGEAGSAAVPVLVDFGAARLLDGPATGFLAISDVTPGYAAPEQYVQDGREGVWTDLYGVAAVAWRIIAGRPPPDALARIRGEAMAPAVDVGRGRYSRAFLASVDRALSLDPALRPTSARAWSLDLQASAVGTEAAEAYGDPTPPAGSSPRASPTNAREDDEGAPTVAIRRVPWTDVGAGHPGAAPAPAVAGAVPGRWRRRWAWVAAALVLLAALPIAARWGWSYYLENIKSEWIVAANGDGDVETIAQALATAKAGATVKVRPGVYRETLVMARPVDLRGDGEPADIVVVGSGAAPCVAITAASGSISGLSFRGETTDVARSVPCLDIDGDSTAVVADSLISNQAGPGLRVHGTAAPTISGNRFAETAGPAVVIADQARGTFGGNAVAASGGAGIVVRDEAAPLVLDNRLEGAGQAGILITGSAGGRFAENDIITSALAGVEVRGRADPSVVGNRIHGAKQAGLYLHGGTRALLEGNEILGSAFSGVVVGQGANPMVVGNAIRDNKEHGILVLAGGRGRYEGNTVTGNGGHGLALDRNAEIERGDNIFDGNLEPQVVVGETPDPGSRAERPDTGDAEAAP